MVTEGVRFSRSGGGLGAAAAGAKGCTDCAWAVAPACQDSGPAESGLCAGALVGCPDPGQLRYRVYLRRGAGPWVLRGSVCLGPGQRPAGAVDLGLAVRERVRRYLPAAHPSFQPRAGAIVNLPTIFAAGQPATLRTEPFELLGFTVVVTARARWVWTFDRGVTGAFGVPGGGYPDRSVTHTYPDPGHPPGPADHLLAGPVHRRRAGTLQRARTRADHDRRPDPGAGPRRPRRARRRLTRSASSALPAAECFGKNNRGMPAPGRLA